MNKRIVAAMVIAAVLVGSSYVLSDARASTTSQQVQTTTQYSGSLCSGGTVISSYSDYEPEGGCWGCDSTASYPATCSDQTFVTTEYTGTISRPSDCSVTCSTRSGTTTIASAPGGTTHPSLNATRTTTNTAWKYTYSTTTVTATLVANPSTITRGDSSALTWTSSNATTCTGTNFSTGNATSGTVTVSPTTNTTYTVSCTNSGVSASDSQTVTVNNVLGVSCVASPQPGTLYQTVTWSSSASGGTGSYTYSWTGTDGLSSTAANPTKTYSSTGTKTATLTVTSGSSQVVTMCNNAVCQSPTCTCTGAGCGVVVNEGTTPDLTVTAAPTLYSGLNEAGNNVTFQGTIVNDGDQTISQSFQNRFQVDIGGDGTYDLNLDASSAAYSIAPSGSSTVVSPTWSDIPLGTHKVRFCADLPPAGSGSVSESNEGNNCGPTLTFAVGASPLTVSISSTPKRAKSGGSSTVTWSSTGADSCTVSGPGLSSSGTSGAQAVTITKDSTYTITCTRGTVTSSATTNVQLAPAFEEI